MNFDKVHLVGGGTVFSPGHMTKMAAMPIYGKMLNISETVQFPTHKPYILVPWVYSCVYI